MNNYSYHKLDGKSCGPSKLWGGHKPTRQQPTSLLRPAYRETWAVVMMLTDFVLFANIVLKIFGL